MDADEFYRPAEVRAAIAQIRERRLTSTSVSSFFHLRRPVWRALDSTNVAFITRLWPWTRIGVPSYPVGQVDSTRKLRAVPMRHAHFGPETVAMYHMNFVRRDLAQKLRNTSTQDTDFLQEVARSIEAWAPSGPFDFPRKGLFEMQSVSNEFATYDPGGD